MADNRHIQEVGGENYNYQFYAEFCYFFPKLSENSDKFPTSLH